MYTHRRHRTVGLPAQVLHHPLHDGGDGGWSKAAGGRHSSGGYGGGVEGGVGGFDHHLCHILRRLPHHRRDVDGGVRGVDRGGDDGGGGVVVHLLVDSGQVVTRRHLLRVPLDPLPQGHHSTY